MLRLKSYILDYKIFQTEIKGLLLYNHRHITKLQHLSKVNYHITICFFAGDFLKKTVHNSSNHVVITITGQVTGIITLNLLHDHMI